MALSLLVLAAATTCAVGAALVDLVRGGRRIRQLIDTVPAPTGPSVSIVVAARDEARHVERAARSLMRLEYPSLEIVFVDDRSTDGTGAILDRLAHDERTIRVIHVTDLPPGWLGKNHALATGAAAASGDLLLFTDADVVFEPTAIARAVTVMEADTLDHLAAIPTVHATGVALKAFIAAFGVFFTLHTRPWRVRDPRSRAHIGIGAFNLLRATAYRRIGTHRAIAMRPDDDLKLGKLVKKHGLRQDVISARDFIGVEWYGSLREMIDGLMKNAFAGVNYSVPQLIGATAGLLLINVWPFVAIFLTSGTTRALNAATAVLVALVFRAVTRRSGTSIWYVVAYPAATILFVYVMWRSALLALVRGSVTWRGTRYPLSELRGNRV